METCEKVRRWLGVPVPCSVALALDLVGDFGKWIGDRFSEPEVRMRQLRQKREKFTEFLAEDRSLAADRAVLKGQMILELRALNGPGKWEQLVRSTGISRRTAQNLVALAIFARRSPDLFEKLKRLGPTKLYRLARLAPEALKDLHLDAEVATERGAVRLRNLTDRELEIHLRLLNPPRIRLTREKLKAACVSVRRMLENVPRSERPPREDLEMIRDALRDATSRVVDMLGQAA